MEYGREQAADELQESQYMSTAQHPFSSIMNTIMFSIERVHILKQPMVLSLLREAVAHHESVNLLALRQGV